MSYTVDKLLDLTEPDFRALVDREVRGVSGTTDMTPAEIAQLRKELEELAPLLRDPQIIERWHLALIQMKKSVESQLSSRRSDQVKYIHTLSRQQYERKLADYHKWRAGAVRFKSGVEDRLLEIRSARHHSFPDAQVIEEQRNWALTMNHQLVTGILEHKNTVLKEYADDVSEADVQLWGLVKNLTEG